jgi:hypothetical protein
MAQLRSAWLTSALQQTPTSNKLLLSNYRKFTPICSELGYKCRHHWRDKSLVSDDRIEVWFVPSATHLSRLLWCQNEVLGIRAFYLIF